MTRCWFVDDHRADHAVTTLCRLVELPRASYYRWAKAAPSRRLVEDAYLANEIVDIYRQSRGTCERSANVAICAQRKSR